MTRTTSSSSPKNKTQKEACHAIAQRRECEAGALTVRSERTVRFIDEKPEEPMLTARVKRSSEASGVSIQTVAMPDIMSSFPLLGDSSRSWQAPSPNLVRDSSSTIRLAVLNEIRLQPVEWALARGLHSDRVFHARAVPAQPTFIQLSSESRTEARSSSTPGRVAATPAINTACVVPPATSTCRQVRKDHERKDRAREPV